jgi:hypothetical protein
MRFKVSGNDKDTGLPIELTLDAVDVSSAAMLAGQKGIQATHVHQIDASVPPLMQDYAIHATANTSPVTHDSTPLTPKPKARVWLGVLFFLIFILAPWFPGFTLLVGLSLATAIVLYLRVPRMEQRLSQFFRVSSDHPNWRIIRLTMFGFASLIIIMTSIGGYMQQRATAELIAKNAADEAAREKAESDANLQVTSLIEKAKNALIIGNLDTAEQAINTASKINAASNRNQLLGLQAAIKKSTDANSAFDTLIKLSDSDFDAFKTSNNAPASFDLGYPILTDNFVASAKSQYEKAITKRAEMKKQADDKAKADAKLAATKAAEQQKVQEAARQAAIKAAMPRATEVFTMAEEYVKATLKAPSTASFGGIFSDYQDPDSNVIVQSDGTYVVRIWVDAQNSFGAMLRSHFVLKLKYLGGDDLSDNSWQLLDIQSDS